MSATGPRTITRRIIQDAAGDLWLATFSGVVRYDGSVFTSVTNQAELKPVRAFSLLRDRADNIWIGTLGAGVYRYDGRSFTNFTTRDGLAGDRVLSISQDRANDIWFGLEGAGVTRYDGRSFTSFGKRDGLTDGDISSIVQDHEGNMWFGSRDGLFRYDGESFVDAGKPWGVPTGGYIPLLVDRTGTLWFGGRAGLHRVDGRTHRQLTTEASWALAQDSKGDLWFGGGPESAPATLNRLKPRALGTAREPEIWEAARLDGMLFDIFEDRDGHIWVGTLRGVGRLEGTGIRFY